MKAVISKGGVLRVGDRPDPIPSGRQVLLEVLRCGICGSDLHANTHCDHWGHLMVRSGYSHFMNSQEDAVFGHEFCGDILEYGPDCKKTLSIGTTVTALPVLKHGKDIILTGLSNITDGAYAERVLVDESMMLEVPNGLNVDTAALTEPLAVAWHAVARGEVKRRDVAIVIGCGPVGLATISILKARGVSSIVACDLSETRRRLATQCGADIVVNPTEESPYQDWSNKGFLPTVSSGLDFLFDTMGKFEKLPVPWWHAWRIAEKLGLEPPRPIIFECVGVPGLLHQVINGAPKYSRIVVVGVCMQSDTIEPALAINKEVDLRFVLGYTPLEFRDTLRALANGKLNVAPMVTGTVGLDGVQGAFDALGSAESHAKVLINPKIQARLNHEFL